MTMTFIEAQRILAHWFTFEELSALDVCIRQIAREDRSGRAETAERERDEARKDFRHAGQSLKEAEAEIARLRKSVETAIAIGVGVGLPGVRLSRILVVLGNATISAGANLPTGTAAPGRGTKAAEGAASVVEGLAKAREALDGQWNRHIGGLFGRAGDITAAIDALILAHLAAYRATKEKNDDNA